MLLRQAQRRLRDVCSLSARGVATSSSSSGAGGQQQQQSGALMEGEGRARGNDDGGRFGVPLFFLSLSSRSLAAVLCLALSLFFSEETHKRSLERGKREKKTGAEARAASEKKKSE